MKTSTCCHLLIVVVISFQLFTVTKAQGPVISGLPSEIRVGELESGQRFLRVLSISDSNSFTCDAQIDGELGGAAVADNNDEFQVKHNTKTGNYELWTKNTAAFDNTVIDTYAVTITCTDANGDTGTGTVDMVLVNNARLTINNVEGTNLTLDALLTPQGTLVKTVSSTSVGSTGSVQYSLTSDPSFSPEFFVIDSSSGDITTNRDLQFLATDNSTLYLDIAVYDPSTQLTVYATQTVQLENQNTVPTTTNMITPLQETKLETLAAGTVLFTCSAADPDAQTLTFRHTCTPTAAEDIFEIDANGNFMIATGKSMDYESISSITCSCYIHDTIDEGGPFIYELTVADDNEPPVFSEIMYYVTTTEGSKGSVSFDPEVTCTDPDTGDTTSYEFLPVNSSEKLAIDSNGVMSLNTDYDVDNSVDAAILIVTLCCKDSGHIDGTSLSACSQVTVTINDINDNAPIFTAPSYTFTVDQTVTPGTVIGTITPNDADSGTNANPTCSGVSSSAYSSTFTIAADCNVYLSSAITFADGTHVGYLATATDGGNPALTGQAGVDIIYQEVATTTVVTTTTTEAYNFFDHALNIVLFTFALLMGLALLGLLAWCLMRFCCGGMCGGGGRGMCDCMGGQRNRGRRRRYPRRAVSPDSHPRRKVRPPSPVIEQPRVVQKKVPVQVVRTVARPAYGGLRPLPQQYPVIRSGPTLPPSYF